MIYLPQVGYILTINPWDVICQDGEKEIRRSVKDDELNGIKGLEYLFRVNGTPCFKTSRCREMDVILGDTATSIAEYEMTVMTRMAQVVLAKIGGLLHLANRGACLDYVLALASVAIDHDWRQPHIVPLGEIKIVGGRHPLVEETCSALGRPFVPNFTNLGANEGAKIAVLSGPNACGKSVYLKQVHRISSWSPGKVKAMFIYGPLLLAGWTDCSVGPHG